MDERYDPQTIEPKWQKAWAEADLFRAVPGPGEAEVLRPRDVPVPVGPPAHGARAQLLDRRRGRAHQADAGVRRALPDGLGRLRAAGRERRHQGRASTRAKWTYDNIANMRRQLQRMGFSYDWAPRDRDLPPGLLPVGAAALHRDVRARAGLPQGAPWSTGARSARRCSPTSRWSDGYCWRHEDTPVEQKELDAVVPQDHRLRRGAARRSSTSLEGGWPERVLTMQRNWIGKSEGAEIRFALERPVGRDRRRSRSSPPGPTRSSAPPSCASPPSTRWRARSPAGTPQEEAVRDVRRARRRRGPRSSATREDYEKEGVFTGALLRQPRHRRAACRSTSPTSCSWSTARARSWRCRRTTSATSSSPGSTGSTSSVVIQPPGRAELDARDDDGGLRRPGRDGRARAPFDGMPNEEGKAQGHRAPGRARARAGRRSS